VPGCPTPPQRAAFGRAVVFGACGFLGRELVRLLLDSGARVLGVDTRPWPGALPEGYAHEAGGEAALGQAAAFLRQGRAGLAGCSGSCSAGQGGLPPGPPLGEEGYDCAGAAQDAGRAGLAAFFHMAGLADAGACQKNPELARRLNVDLVAEALAALSGVACAFVFPSTGIVYGDALGRPAREDDPLLPAAQYARGKDRGEGLMRAALPSGPPARASPGLSISTSPARREHECWAACWPAGGAGRRPLRCGTKPGARFSCTWPMPRKGCCAWGCGQRPWFPLPGSRLPGFRPPGEGRLP
jgi:uncharacterized protein YbjT (DUF2867 family)